MTADTERLQHPGNALEWFSILSMIEPLTREQAADRRAAFGIDTPLGDSSDWFSCRHWDEGTRLCRAYEQRPHLCRGYPGYGRADSRCEHGCDCKGAT